MILFITNDLKGENGWSMVSVNILREIKRFNKVLTVTRKGGLGDCQYFARDGHRNPLQMIRDARKITKKALRINEKVSSIICAIEPFLPISVIIKRWLNVKKLILIGHGTYIYYPFVQFPKCLISRLFSTAVDNLVVPSEFTRNRAAKWYKREISVVPWGVNEPRSKYLTRDRKHFIFIGELKERKGVSTLFDAISLLRSEFREIKLIMIGEIHLKYVEESRLKGLENNITFKGVVSEHEKNKLLRRAFALVLPSINVKDDFEGFGLVHLEANANGVASIGSRFTANEEVILDGKTGFLCNQGDAFDLSEKMRRFLVDKNLALTMGLDGILHAKRMNWEVVGRRFEHIIGNS